MKTWTNVIEMNVTPQDFIRASRVGMHRFEESYLSGRNHRTTEDRDFYNRLLDETTGALAELVFARFLGVDWSESINTFHDIPDVGRVWEVRSTRRAQHSSCIVRDNDSDDRKYALVKIPHMHLTDGLPGDTAYLIGWITGKEAKQDRFVRESTAASERRAYFVGERYLFSFEEGVDYAC